MEKSEYNQNYPPAYDHATGPGVQPGYPPLGGYSNPQGGNMAPTPQYPVPVSVPMIPQRQATVMVQQLGKSYFCIKIIFMFFQFFYINNHIKCRYPLTSTVVFTIYIFEYKS